VYVVEEAHPSKQACVRGFPPTQKNLAGFGLDDSEKEVFA